MEFWRSFRRRSSSFFSSSEAAAVKKVTEDETRLLFQAFEWHVPADQAHWRRLRKMLPDLKRLGVTHIWLPPGCKAANAREGNGYDAYDLWDLGEFDQKGSRSTKWGSVEDLRELCRACHEMDIGVIWDAILNHKAGADGTETTMAVKVDPEDRTRPIAKPAAIRAWLHWSFSGRNDTYDDFQWHESHFNGTDWDDQTREKNRVYKILGTDPQSPRAWAPDVGVIKGNDDYLLLNNIDHTAPGVEEQLIKWGKWITSELSLAGFRLDAIQHVSPRFTNAWLSAVQESYKENEKLLIVGEYWSLDLPSLLTYITQMKRRVHLYDAPLQTAIYRASEAPRPDLRSLFRDSLVRYEPALAVTVTTTHDTQPHQSIHSPIAGWFAGHGYALILLRREGLPCVFYGDMYGIKGGPVLRGPVCEGLLPSFMLGRKWFARGTQREYFDEQSCVGWTREGIPLSTGHGTEEGKDQKGMSLSHDSNTAHDGDGDGDIEGRGFGISGAQKSAVAEDLEEGGTRARTKGDGSGSDIVSNGMAVIMTSAAPPSRRGGAGVGRHTLQPSGTASSSSSSSSSGRWEKTMFVGAAHVGERWVELIATGDNSRQQMGGRSRGGGQQVPTSPSSSQFRSSPTTTTTVPEAAAATNVDMLVGVGTTSTKATAAGGAGHGGDGGLGLPPPSTSAAGQEIVIDAHGQGRFSCWGRGVSVWVPEPALRYWQQHHRGQEEYVFPVQIPIDIYDH